MPFRSLQGRTHIGQEQCDAAGSQRAGYEQSAKHAAAGKIRVDTRRYSLDDAGEAWQAQKKGPDGKSWGRPSWGDAGDEQVQHMAGLLG